ncbi:hypothetical protein [Alkaliphilus serpentinus]|uniref:GNAT family N-acetyltransferase n=1 Tax=Alkaliphilus serpentinus TaxID=1482731 RepID=A0A833HPB1_9FIRM|nr:hypothetical protein [Alkaliphilus serpentinus]KAB3530511.1 hypothetical protein F8153_06580 [Alkaliphilus serpentinus]
MAKEIKGSIVEVYTLTNEDIEMMYRLMDTFYDNMTRENFLRDLKQKDYSIVLRDEDHKIWGFSTQQILHIPLKDQVIHGVFSGDTIIHKDYWGSMELFIVFARFFFEFEEKYQDFYWFLICKGYKTYRMLPTFYKTFYPNYKEDTPQDIQAIMDAFGRYYSPEEYDEATGVLCYKGVKDKLKENVADVSEERLRDKNIAFFVEKNPDYTKGNDIVCITKLSKSNLKPRMRRFLLGY